MAERDQQRLVRKERRKLQKKKKLRAQRMKIIEESLKIRENYRKRTNQKMRSTSADSYDRYTDHDYQKTLLLQQAQLKSQIAA